MNKKALIILAQGFEEVEAVTPMDFLKRAGIAVTVAGLGSDTVTGAHGLTVKADTVLEKTDDEFDVLILPGGMPGAENLASSTEVRNLIQKMNSAKKIVAAICASPALVLVPSGVLDGKEATCFPGMERVGSSGVKFVKDNVVKDGNIITSRGAGTAVDFSIKIAEVLVGRDKAEMIAEQMQYKV